MTDAPTCTEDGCTDEAVAESKAPDGTRWEPVCKRHAHGSFELGHDVRSIVEGDGVECPECGGRVRVSDAIFADCETCGADYLRDEVGL
jgi:DNA-directed RNA polymerase subunit RPC12/RpoP